MGTMHTHGEQASSSLIILTFQLSYPCLQDQAQRQMETSKNEISSRETTQEPESEADTANVIAGNYWMTEMALAMEALDSADK